MGKALGTACVTNVWIPDGMKDTPVDRMGPESAADRIARCGLRGKARPGAQPRCGRRKAVRHRLRELYVVGSHEFYLAYALTRKVLYLDAGHYHPTETITDKISAVLSFLPEILLHVSRGVRWDSDHVVVLNDDLERSRRSWSAATVAENAYRPGLFRREHQSRRRVGDWGAQYTEGAAAGDAGADGEAARVRGGRRLHRAPGAAGGDQESPWGAVWDHYCSAAVFPTGQQWLDAVKSTREPSSRRG